MVKQCTIECIKSPCNMMQHDHHINSFKGSSQFLILEITIMSPESPERQHPQCAYVYLCLSHHLRYCIWSVCIEYLDVTAQLLDICAYAIYVYIYIICMWKVQLFGNHGLWTEILYHWATEIIFHQPGCNHEIKEIPLEVPFSR